MGIRSVNVRLSEVEPLVSSLGLDRDFPLDMYRLGSIVVLAGPNGGGKTRVLKIVEKLCAVFPQNRHQITLSTDESFFKNQIQAAKDQIGKGEDIEDNRQKLEEYEAKLREICIRKNLLSALAFSSGEGLTQCFALTPFNWRVGDISGRTLEWVSSEAGPIDRKGVSGTMSDPAGYAFLLELRALQEDSEKERAESLRVLTKKLLGKEFTYHLEGLRIVFNGSKVYWETLSPGQQVLFYLACLLHSGETKKGGENAIYFLDEPEAHLHPDAARSLIKSLRSSQPKCQIWIATHSLSLIADLLAEDPNCLWYVNEGSIRPASRNPSSLLKGLLGDSTAGAIGASLREFLSLPDVFARNRFLAECLNPPGVHMTGANDPQGKQIADLNPRPGTCNPIRLLDFGAGKARILHSLAENLGNPIKSYVDYFAYDVDKINRSECLATIREYYPNAEQRWHGDRDSLLSTAASSKFDAVLLCNVLHEIAPKEWLSIFGPGGILQSIVDDSGAIWIVEDYGIPVGERAHSTGFLLLDEAELRILFGAGHEESFFGVFDHPDLKYRGRLKAFNIAKPLLGNVTRSSISNSIESLQSRALREIQKMLGNAEVSSQNARNEGHRFALLAVQHLFSTLCLQQLEDLG